MKALVVRPGPDWSVLDVANGWCDGLAECGYDVVHFDLGSRIGLFAAAHVPDGDDYRPALPSMQVACELAAEHVLAAVWRVQPDLVVVICGGNLPSATFAAVRSRGIPIVLVHTESPYEDDAQVARAPLATLNVINDPTHLDRFRAANPASIYVPASYRPGVHRPRPARSGLASDVAFVGSGFEQRIAYLCAGDWSGIDLLLAGTWPIDDDHPLDRHLWADQPDDFCDNDTTADIYAATKSELQPVPPGLRRCRRPRLVDEPPRGRARRHRHLLHP